MSNTNHPIENEIENAYLAGYEDGKWDERFGFGRVSGEDVSRFFDNMVGDGEFLLHQKPQYLAGYARGARGEKD